MNKIYNTQEEIASKIKDFLLEIFPNIRKTQLKIIPYIIIGMINAESSVASDISRELKDDFSLVQHDSVIKRIKRFFVNKFFNPYFFYDKIIRHIISNYKVKHPDKRIHIIFDHMFSRDNYTVFMISMRVGKQGIPLWFRCFKGNNDPNAFNTEFLKEGISYVSSLFDKDYDLIFLADRWFGSFDLLNHIKSLNHTYCVRLKDNVKALVLNKRSGYKIWTTTGKISAQKGRAKYFRNIELTNDLHLCNLVISSSLDVKEPWIIVTNGNPNRAIKDYSYRFGGIESLFKNQKSNGLYIESTVNASLKYFESMYTMVCFSTLFLTIFGADYTKNTKCYKKHKLTTHKRIKNKEKRVMSLFSIGLTLFKRAFNSLVYIRIPFNFILYDI